MYFSNCSISTVLYNFCPKSWNIIHFTISSLMFCAFADTRVVRELGLKIIIRGSQNNDKMKNLFEKTATDSKNWGHISFGRIISSFDCRFLFYREYILSSWWSYRLFAVRLLYTLLSHKHVFLQFNQID